MAKNIVVEQVDYTPISRQRVELVERKGIGHPDSIADGLAESVSRALCQMYIEKFGRILHHNTDETQIVGGQSAPRFGGGVMLEPIYILLVGRATNEVNGQRLPIRHIAIKAASDYLCDHFPNLDVSTDVMLDCRIGKGSVDLTGIYETKKLLANDTSFGVGYAPLSETEKVVLESEKFINGPLKKKLKEAGEDVKVMASRNNDTVNLTIACAMVDRHIDDANHYENAIAEMRERVADHATKFTKKEVKVDVNTADDYRNGIYYLTVTGLSMENGDDGSVGRGNRVNGLITPYRPMSMEASAGKNPVTHVGKLYNILAKIIAEEIAKEGGGDVLEARVRLLSQIGRPIYDPQTASVQLILDKNAKAAKLHKAAVRITDYWLENIGEITGKVVNGKISVF
ncbi:MAG: methionine adenosyltransferase [Euryarchaeota archaeon]|nr:methionine adenosyltransferase [Euryarchaeota archaeon]